jgi:hypothetical protein
MDSTTLAPSKAGIEELRLRVQQRLRERREKPGVVPPNPPPRYDEVFFQGTQWLDEIAAGPDLDGGPEP